mgnify:CR=1 FL=1
MALDEPAAASKGVAVIAHPHPLFGGTMDNKVVQTLAKVQAKVWPLTWRLRSRLVLMTAH